MFNGTSKIVKNPWVVTTAHEIIPIYYYNILKANHRQLVSIIIKTSLFPFANRNQPSIKTTPFQLLFAFRVCLFWPGRIICKINFMQTCRQIRRHDNLIGRDMWPAFPLQTGSPRRQSNNKRGACATANSSWTKISVNLALACVVLKGIPPQPNLNVLEIAKYLAIGVCDPLSTAFW